MIVSKRLTKCITNRTLKYFHVWANLRGESGFLSDGPNSKSLLKLVDISSSVRDEFEKNALVELSGSQNIKRRRNELILIHKKLLQDCLNELGLMKNTLQKTVGTAILEIKECSNNPEATRLFKIAVESMANSNENSDDISISSDMSEIKYLNINVDPLIDPVLRAIAHQELIKALEKVADNLILKGVPTVKPISENIPKDLLCIINSNSNKVWTSSELKKEFGDKFQRPNDLPWDANYKKRVDKNIHRLARQYPARIKLDMRKSRSRLNKS